VSGKTLPLASRARRQQTARPLGARKGLIFKPSFTHIPPPHRNVRARKDISMKRIAGLFCLGLLAATPAVAENTDMKSMDHMKMQMNMGSSSAESAPSSKAFEAADEKMHQDMTMSFTGDADVDFVKGMIPHHQGAIDMAKVELQYGKDPELRKLAEDITKAQETEITLMDAWLAKHQK
jgi:uncharacterized protein (DUF305 family)